MTLPSGWEDYQHNFLGLEEPWCHPEQAGVYVLPVPYEHTSSYIHGSDEGPSAIIEASQQVEFYDEMLRCEPYREWGGIATVTPLNLKGLVDKEAVEAIEAFVRPYVGTGKFLVTLTGEHTGALGAIRAHAKRYPRLTVVQIDAHGDLRHAYQDNLYSHASVMARVADDGLPLVQVGIRSICPEEVARIARTDHISTFFCGPAAGPGGSLRREIRSLDSGRRESLSGTGVSDLRLRRPRRLAGSCTGHARTRRTRLVRYIESHYRTGERARHPRNGD
jgi:agmatinase